MKITDQPSPTITPGQSQEVMPVLRQYMDERYEQKKAEYGTSLHTHNGRNPLIDLLQELMDGTQYAVQAQLEDEQRRAWEGKALLEIGAAKIMAKKLYELVDAWGSDYAAEELPFEQWPAPLQAAKIALMEYCTVSGYDPAPDINWKEYPKK